MKSYRVQIFISDRQYIALDKIYQTNDPEAAKVLGELECLESGLEQKSIRKIYVFQTTPEVKQFFSDNMITLFATWTAIFLIAAIILLLLTCLFLGKPNNILLKIFSIIVGVVTVWIGFLFGTYIYNSYVEKEAEK